MEIETALSTGASGIPIVRAWNDVETSIIHGFIGRQGGVSAGAFASMNLSYFVGDDARAVDENWERLRREVPELKLVARVNQVHGNIVQVVTRATASSRARADGMVTRDPGVMLGIFTADCVPILMIDEKRKIAGAIHAGWRGVIAGIVANGVDAMVSLGADIENIRAVLGPSIGPCCFEVDATLAERFVREIEGSERHARAGRPGKAYLDLRGLVRDRLIGARLADVNISAVGPCTRCASERFFSRRAAGGKTTGLQMSFVGFAE
ncbi:MAG: peptidoglycan editing factor PgeF [Candidatus Binatus sp.]|uniref:peptidoglycan editing factor PgeF n=1 Tax=Candidatus Binatus sp. TaxID=2811406 RepID=UPI00271F807F|nr:peptidoglycan editing factor PgeF [Candidatus Binatus sp.]MDO8433777.1 peptidoglycan editing factor PgeF [Candidatus Binatus sp.]